MSTLYRLPEEVTGYALDSIESYWSVIQPEATTNLITNPSFETATLAGLDGYTVSTIGTYSVKTDGHATSGISYFYILPDVGTGNTIAWTHTTVAGTAYTLSLDAYLTIDNNYFLLVTDGATDYARSDLITPTYTGWHRLSLSYVDNVAMALEFTFGIGENEANNAHSRAAVYLDSWQLEAKAYPTTYCDGDMIDIVNTRRTGISPYHWTGVRHDSTSVRTANTNSGGRMIPFSDYGFQTTSIVGLGMTDVSISTFDLGYGGQVYQGSSVPSSEFTITGTVFAKSLSQLTAKRKGLVELLRPNKTPDRQQLMLLHQWRAPNGDATSELQRVICAYTEGLRGNITNYFQESIALKFYATDPYPRSYFARDADATIQNTWENMGVDIRTVEGTWDRPRDNTASAPTSNSTGTAVYAVAYRNEEQLWIGGAFTALGGTVFGGGAVSANRIAVFYPTLATPVIQQPGDGFNAAVEDIAVGQTSDQFVVAVGAFTTDGLGIATYRYAAIWNGSGWSELGIGFNAYGKDIAAHPSGDFYIVGNFTADSAAGAMYRCARYNSGSSTLVALDSGGSTGLNGFAGTVVLGPDGNIYIGGSFTDLFGAAANTYMHVIRYNVATDDWTALGDGFNNNVTQLAFSPDGILYAVGSFTQDGTSTYTLRYFAKWNGTTWEEVGNGNSPTSLIGLFFDADGVAYVYSATVVKRFNGSVWLPGDALWDSTYYVQDMCLSPSGKLVAGGAVASGTMTGSQATTVTTEGTADSVPLIRIEGPGTITQIINNTTKTGIYFDSGFTLNTDEILYVRLGSKLQVWSNWRSNLLNYVTLGASALAEFRLAPGDNDISVLIYNDDTPTACHLIWNDTNWGVD